MPRSISRRDEALEAATMIGAIMRPITARRL